MIHYCVMGWQVIERVEKDGSRVKIRSVSLSRRGVLRFSRKAWKAMPGIGEFAVMMYDAELRRIGIRRVMPSDKNCIKVQYHRGYDSSRLIGIKRLLDRFDIKITETLTFREPLFDDRNVLILELDRAYVSERTTKHWKRIRKKENSHES